MNLIAAIIGIVILSVVILVVETLLVMWIGPLTGIDYFDTASFGNLLALVVTGNIIAGGGTAVNSSK